jgi:hypothetical protein
MQEKIKLPFWGLSAISSSTSPSGFDGQLNGPMVEKSHDNEREEK